MSELSSSRIPQKLLCVFAGGIIGAAVGVGVYALASGVNIFALPILQATHAASIGFAGGAILGALAGVCFFPSKASLELKYKKAENNYREWDKIVRYYQKDTPVNRKEKAQVEQARKGMNHAEAQMLKISTQLAAFSPDDDSYSNERSVVISSHSSFDGDS